MYSLLFNNVNFVNVLCVQYVSNMTMMCLL